MPESLTPLSVAFIWHMHQPEYKDNLTGEYLMPWVRLHAIKDYLDMALILEKYPRIRQTFNLVPSLIDQLEDYCRPETLDKHMRTMLKESFSDEDKYFIFERFFDAAAHTMIGRSPYYYSLFERRNKIWEQGDPDITQFTDQEYRDITALFNLVWFDPMWLHQNDELSQLWQKQKGYTLADTTRILELQREIIQRVIPEYKALQEKGQIEITTTPYYHPILPLLINSDSARVAMPDAVLPEEPFQYPRDAEYHVKAAWQKYQSLFGMAPAGVWPAEQSISPEAIRLLKQHGFEWAVSSEGNLCYSLGVPLEKDHFGNVQNAEVLCQSYRFEGMNLLFRNLTLSDLVGFHYSQLPADVAVQDFIHRLKHIQKRCTAMGLENPIVTIALDGENCWEFFPNDGHEFLHKLYAELSKDESLIVCRVQDYFDQMPQEAIKPLSYLHSGSWINSNFHIWIGDPVKNAAWMYLKRTRNDLEHLTQTGHYTPDVLERAWKEIFIAEGSDWFWWYGEPHNSGQDDVFDMQFRRHLANVYRLMDLEIPNYLDIPLSITMGRPVTMPTGPITPQITGKAETFDDWQHAGCFDLTHGAMHRATRILNKVYFGSDTECCYIRFDLNKETLTPYHELFLYCCTPGKTRHNSPVRVKGASGRTVSTQRYHYGYEIQLSELTPGQLRIASAEALPDHLWYHRPDLVKEAKYEEVLEIAIPFDRMNIHAEEYLQVGIALVQGGILEEYQPEHFLLSVQRYDRRCHLSSTTPTVCELALEKEAPHPQRVIAEQPTP